MSEIPYPFKSVLQVMKPCKIKSGNENHIATLDGCFDSADYAIEEKIDGHHYTCIGGRFFSTHISAKTGWPTEKTANFPHLEAAFMQAGMGHAILDGEISFLGKKSQDITPVSNSAADKAIEIQERIGWIDFRMFDILRAPNGEWLVNKPFRKRREYLEAVGRKLNLICKHYIVNPIVYNNKRQFVDKIIEEGGEGGVLKHLGQPYILGQRPMWNQIKIKQEMEDDVLILGYNSPERIYTGKNLETWPYWDQGEPVTEFFARSLIGSLQVGKLRDGVPVILGNVSGMTLPERVEFSTNGTAYLGKVAKIRGMEKTHDGAYRHFSFTAMHPDKNPQECRL